MNFNFFPGFLEILLAVILGIVQGLTEFLPISSTAHLRLVSGFFGGKDIGLTASNVIQFGTLLAILQYFRVDLQVFWQRIVEILSDQKEMQQFVQTFQNWFKNGNLDQNSGIFQQTELEEIEKKDSNNSINTDKTRDKLTVNLQNSQHDLQENLQENLEKSNLKNDELRDKIGIKNVKQQTSFENDILLSQLIIGTIPIVILGFLLRNFAETNRNIGEIGLFMIMGGLLLGFGEYFYTKTSTFKHSKIQTFGETLMIGLFQSLAIFPGMSRSGSTLAGSLFVGRNRQKSVRFVFLLSVPALFLSGILDFISLVREIFKNGITILPQDNFAAFPKLRLSIVSLLISFGLAYVVGLFCLRWLLRFLSTNTNLNFIIYRILLGFCLILLSFISASIGFLRF